MSCCRLLYHTRKKFSTAEEDADALDARARVRVLQKPRPVNGNDDSRQKIKVFLKGRDNGGKGEKEEEREKEKQKMEIDRHYVYGEANRADARLHRGTRSLAREIKGLADVDWMESIARPGCRTSFLIMRSQAGGLMRGWGRERDSGGETEEGLATRERFPSRREAGRAESGFVRKHDAL